MKVTTTTKWLRISPPILAVALVAGASLTAAQGPVFRATTNYVSTDVIVRDREGKFVPDLRMDEFTVYEDGVPQKIVTFVPSIGGRIIGSVASTPPPAAAVEGLVLPAPRPAADASGRIFIILIDDLHLQADATPNVRQMLQLLRDTLLHDNDLVGFVSTGYSSIESDLSYDFGHRRFNEAINKVMGAGKPIMEIIQDQGSIEGPAGVRHAAQVAFRTAADMLEQASKITNRRKSFIYVSNGYHFDPFKDSRYKYAQQNYGLDAIDPNSSDTDSSDGVRDERSISQIGQGSRDYRVNFAFADLIGELAHLVRVANRANVTFYTVDPRGLMTTGISAEFGFEISQTDWADLFLSQTNSLRVLAEETGGFCICQSNDFKGGFQRIDNETSDYYILGYYSSNPDPLKLRRTIEIEISRPGLQRPIYRPEYTLERPRRDG